MSFSRIPSEVIYEEIYPYLSFEERYLLGDPNFSTIIRESTPKELNEILDIALKYDDPTLLQEVFRRVSELEHSRGNIRERRLTTSLQEIDVETTPEQRVQSYLEEFSLTVDNAPRIAHYLLDKISLWAALSIHYWAKFEDPLFEARVIQKAKHSDELDFERVIDAKESIRKDLLRILVEEGKINLESLSRFDHLERELLLDIREVLLEYGLLTPDKEEQLRQLQGDTLFV